MKQILLQPAYILHRRAYRESSALIELFTRDHGRIAVIAKGIRKPRNTLQCLLQPFTPLLVSLAGRHELKILADAEVNGSIHLSGENVFAGFYLNELLISLLQKWDAHPQLFAVYHDTLLVLQSAVVDQPIFEQTLRQFEKKLLIELGYGLLPGTASTLQTFLPEKYYQFIPEQGLVVNEAASTNGAANTLFLGKNLLEIAAEKWNKENLQEAKRLMRFALSSLLGARQINSRKLFRKTT